MAKAITAPNASNAFPTQPSTINENHKNAGFLRDQASNTHPSTTSSYISIPSKSLPYPAIDLKSPPQPPIPSTTPSPSVNDIATADSPLPSPIDSMALAPSITETVRVDTTLRNISTDAVATMVKVDSIAQKPAPVMDTLAVQPVVAAAPLLEPVITRDKRWKAGVRLMMGRTQPKERGISLILGQGAGVEYRIWRQLSLSANIDLLKFDVEADTIPSHLVDINLPPQGLGHHFPDLKQVVANQVMQRYSLRAHFTQHLVGRWYASLQAAHTWMFMPSRLVSFEFEEMGPHGPGPVTHHDTEFLAIRAPKLWESNVWNLGVGIQYQTPRWVFGITSDYSKGFNGDNPLLDAVYASANVQYKF